MRLATSSSGKISAGGFGGLDALPARDSRVAPPPEKSPEPSAGSSVAEAAFRSTADRRFALDRAHRGDIVGALGRVSAHDTGPRLYSRQRLLTLLAVMGPGLAVMVADNDAGGLSMYAQAGQEHGLWPAGLLLILALILYVNQEMVARLGAVTGVGHARLVFERFGRRWGWFALTDLLILNLLTIITEFIGVALALGYFGVSPDISVPATAIGLAVVTGFGSFRRWERAMYCLAGLSLVCLPLAVLSHSHSGAVDAGSRTNAVGGGVLLLVVAMIGTTVAPWQLFLHQSNVVDKRITARWLGYERVDLAVGTGLFLVGGMAVLLTSAIALGGAGHVAFSDAGQAAIDLRQRVGPWAGALFAIALLNASVLGVGAVTLATAYAVGDALGLRHSLHRRWDDAPMFHGTFLLFLLVAAAAVLIPRVPLGIVIEGVQVLAGVLLPSATVFLLLLCNDRAVLGPWVNVRWLNAVAVVVVGALIELSALLTLTTILPGVGLVGPAIVCAVGLLGLLGWIVRSELRAAGPSPFHGTPWERAIWTMPPLESLLPPSPSRSRTAGLILLRVYLLFAVALLALRLVQAVLGA
jgi:Mn2+/Fe2+ NRAMP family transporter